MNDIIYLIIDFVLGMLLGSLYLLGLWETVRRLPESRHPVLWMIISIILRLSLVLGGFFYFISNKQLESFAALFVGFLLIRAIAVRYVLTRRRPANY